MFIKNGYNTHSILKYSTNHRGSPLWLPYLSHPYTKGDACIAPTFPYNPHRAILAHYAPSLWQMGIRRGQYRSPLTTYSRSLEKEIRGGRVF
jgi:hypothetical protein